VLEKGLNGLVAKLIGKVGVHAGGVEVSVLLLERALWAVGGFFEIEIEQIPVALGELVEAPQRDWSPGIGLSCASAAGVLVEISARVCGFIDCVRSKLFGAFGSVGAVLDDVAFWAVRGWCRVKARSEMDWLHRVLLNQLKAGQ